MKNILIFAIILAIFSCKKEEESSDEFPFEHITEIKGFPAIIYPESNPYNLNAVRLGKKLFFDKLLSKDNTISCASCHAPRFAFSDERDFSEGVDDELGGRHAMPAFNLLWARSFFWDGRAKTLEEQALGPVENPKEMAEEWPNVVSKINAHDEYPGLFSQAFGDVEIDKFLVAKAIAQFERQLVSHNSRYDKHLNEEIELSTEEQLGMNLFFSSKTACFTCHGGILFTDDGFHDNGLDASPSDLGRADVTELNADEGKFKTPTLRNIEFTAPYMHDGRFDTLEEVIEHYDSEVKSSPNLDVFMHDARKLELTDEEKAALIAFLKTLSDLSFMEKFSVFDVAD